MKFLKIYWSLLIWLFLSIKFYKFCVSGKTWGRLASHKTEANKNFWEGARTPQAPNGPPMSSISKNGRRGVIYSPKSGRGWRLECCNYKLLNYIFNKLYSIIFLVWGDFLKLWFPKHSFFNLKLLRFNY